MKLTINGENREILKSQNLEDLARELDIQAPNFAMALNQQVVPGPICQIQIHNRPD